MLCTQSTKRENILNLKRFAENPATNSLNPSISVRFCWDAGGISI